MIQCELCRDWVPVPLECGHAICQNCFEYGVDDRPNQCVQCLDAAAQSADPEAANYCTTCGTALRDRMEARGVEDVEWTTFCPECDTQGGLG